MKRAKVTNETEAYIRNHLEIDRNMASGLKWKKAPKFNGHMLGRAAGGTTATDYDIVVSSDRADFTTKCNAKIAAGFLPLGGMSVIQLTPGRMVEYAQAFTKP